MKAKNQLFLFESSFLKEGEITSLRMELSNLHKEEFELIIWEKDYALGSEQKHPNSSAKTYVLKTCPQSIKNLFLKKFKEIESEVSLFFGVNHDWTSDPNLAIVISKIQRGLYFPPHKDGIFDGQICKKALSLRYILFANNESVEVRLWDSKVFLDKKLMQVHRQKSNELLVSDMSKVHQVIPTTHDNTSFDEALFLIHASVPFL
jgi:hypothetical protein